MKISAVIISLLITFSANAGQLLCANTGTGSINIRAKCLKNETAMNLSNAGQLITQKTTNVMGACRTISATNTTTNGTAGVSLTCNPGEYLMNYGDWTEPFLLTVNRSSQLYYDGTIPNGVNLLSQYDFGLIVTPSVTNWTLHATATCCPRF